jgi:hypothetical protein
MTSKSHSVPVHHLALRVREVAQLFNSMDPTPFLNKDLDPQANEYIESWASVHSSYSNRSRQVTIPLRFGELYSLLAGLHDMD